MCAYAQNSHYAFFRSEKGHCLVFWLNEELVSVVHSKSEMGEILVGEERMVKFGKNSYRAKILAAG